MTAAGGFGGTGGGPCAAAAAIPGVGGPDELLGLPDPLGGLVPLELFGLLDLDLPLGDPGLPTLGGLEY